MPKRYLDDAGPVRIASAMRAVARRGYTRQDARADLLAGVITGIVALPLSMALAIACGVPPQHGLYTAIVAGVVTAVCGGSPLQVSGPTAAFVVLLAPVASKFGVAGLLIATLLAGIFLVFMALGRFGRWIEFVPYAVTTGFTAGIATVIAVLQLRDLLGLPPSSGGQHVLDRLAQALLGLPSIHWPDFAIGCLTLALLLLWPKVFPKVPAALVALLVATLAALLLARWVDGFSVSTIGGRFHYTIAGVSGQ
jgi:sulfate permease, SulP family